MGRLTETERNVLELRAPIAGEAIPDAEIARRLGLRRKDVPRIAERAAGKLEAPELGGPFWRATAA
jgi:hypothetical protein